MEGNGVIVFKFENINLDYEASDEEGSKGFVQFKVQQRVDLPIGTEIKNTAAIYFDNNSPIITNQTLHTIGEDHLLTTWIEELPSNQLQEVLVFPNPVKDIVNIEVKDFGQENLQFELYDVLGNRLMTTSFKNKTTSIELKRLMSGTYFFKIYNSNQVIGVGKMVKL